MKNAAIILNAFAKDTLQGLTARPKYLLPKYFYDDEGSRLFRSIMNMPEYYLTDSEIEIFRDKSSEIIKSLELNNSAVDILELGSGDGSKTHYLLGSLTERQYKYKYIPVDISEHANKMLSDKLKVTIPGINIEPRTGDYFNVMKKLERQTGTFRLILFLGSSIGNFSDGQLKSFLAGLSGITMSGDKILMGFDLKKSPDIIMKAYDDPHGLTRDFNLNHLRRINRELDADFDTGQFRHIQEYNEETGEMKSFLVSLSDQEIYLASINERISLAGGERIFMELSRKFDITGIRQMAEDNSFRIIKNFTDGRQYFVDSLWIKE